MSVSSLNRPFRILIALGGAALLLGLLAIKLMMAQVVLALLLVFILPGYALTLALLPKGKLGMVERLLLAVGASLATAILGGLVLNQTPWGLQTSSWIVLLSATSLMAGMVAWVRKEQPPLAAATRPIRFTLQQGSLLILAVLVVGVALNLNYRPAPQQGFQGYTLLWMLPAKASSQDVVRLGVNSKEFTKTTYSLQVKVDGQVAYEWPSIELQPNGQWEDRIKLSSEQLASSTVEAALYRLDTPESVYRHVLLQHDKGEK
jgi:uncharacterized membrane protein